MGNNKEKINLGDLSLENICPGFNSKKFSELVNTSPTMKINLQKNNKLYITGMDLMLRDESEVNYDLSDLNMLTFLFIDKHLLTEVSLMLAGALDIVFTTLEMKNIEKYIAINIKYIIQSVNDIVTYGDLLESVGEIYDHLMNFVLEHTKADIKQIKKLLDKFKYVYKNIWFLSYPEIDRLRKDLYEG